MPVKIPIVRNVLILFGILAYKVLLITYLMPYFISIKDQ